MVLLDPLCGNSASRWSSWRSVWLQSMALGEAVPNSASQISFRLSSMSCWLIVFLEAWIMLTNCLIQPFPLGPMRLFSVDIIFYSWYIDFISVIMFSRFQRLFLFQAQVVSSKHPSPPQSRLLALDCCSLLPIISCSLLTFFHALCSPIAIYSKCRYRPLPWFPKAQQD